MNQKCTRKEAQKIYKIGLFAQMNRLTVKTLRYYDEVGLLNPEFVDEGSGYRYYTSSQLPTLHKILALRDMDFSIQEIKAIFDGASEEAMLQKKKNSLLQSMAALSKKIATVEGYLGGNYSKKDYKIILKSIPTVKIASMAVHLENYSDLFYKMPDMGLEMEQAGCECCEPEYCFTIYHDGEYKEMDIDAELCEAICELKENSEHIVYKTLEEIPLAACVLHKGPYHKLPLAYAAIVEYIEENGYEITGEQRESYIDGVWNKESDEDWLTEIQFPIQKQKEK